MTDISNGALDALVFQLGHAHPDDIDYNAAADTITALRAERDAAREDARWNYVKAALDDNAEDAKAAYARGVQAAADCVAQGWCQPGTSHIEMDVALATGIATVIRALADAPPAPVVKVKPLVWVDGDEPDEWRSGSYDVWCELGRFQLYYWSIVMGEPHDTADAAKAAAQADYDARIRAALEGGEG